MDFTEVEILAWGIFLYYTSVRDLMTHDAKCVFVPPELGKWDDLASHVDDAAFFTIFRS